MYILFVHLHLTVNQHQHNTVIILFYIKSFKY